MLNDHPETKNGSPDDVLQIDLNCDMGEGMETDAAIFPFISSANIACGYHAGDEDTMRRTIEQALQHNVAIGAHPSYPDQVNFGRIDTLDSAPGRDDRSLRYEQLGEILYQQLHTLQKICREFRVALKHVKPHGALYNRGAKDPGVSSIIAGTIAAFDPSLLLYGLSGSEMKKAAIDHGLAFVSEIFADRTYRADGSLTPRTEPDALIEDPDQVVRQVMMMIREGRVVAAGIQIPILAETVCIHGDGAHASEFVRLIHTSLLQKKITIQSPRRSTPSL